MKTSSKLIELLENVVRRVVRSELSMLKQSLLQEIKQQMIMEQQAPQANPYNSQPYTPGYNPTQTPPPYQPTPSYQPISTGDPLKDILMETQPIKLREAMGGSGGSIADYVIGGESIPLSTPLPGVAPQSSPPMVAPKIVQGANGKPINLDTPQSKNALEKMFSKDFKAILQKADQKAKASRGL